jgi:hypothetical protein
LYRHFSELTSPPFGAYTLITRRSPSVAAMARACGSSWPVPSPTTTSPSRARARIATPLYVFCVDTTAW